MPDFDDLLDNEPAFRSGEVALWLAVTINAFFTLRDGGGYQDTARGWIEDQENIFFDAVADRLGYSPDGLRERIREAVIRATRTDRRQTWRDRVRENYTRPGIEREPLPASRLAGKRRDISL